MSGMRSPPHSSRVRPAGGPSPHAARAGRDEITRLLGATGGPHYEVRTKGASVRRRERPASVWRAITAAVKAGRAPQPDAALAAAVAGERGGDDPGAVDEPCGMSRPASMSTMVGLRRVGLEFYSHLRSHAAAAGLDGVSRHVLRHTAAKLRDDADMTA